MMGCSVRHRDITRQCSDIDSASEFYIRKAILIFPCNRL